jgi:phosphatidylglycerol:prolipoprotein diacylglycerol transferase
MYPIILRIANFQIYSYGVMLFISFLIGTKLVEVRARKFGVDPSKITDLALLTLIAVIIGARLLYVIFHWSEFSNDLIGIIAFWRGGLGGLMFFGGLLFALVAGIIFVRKQKLPMLQMLDAIAPAIVLGEGLTRIGCFLNGCCFGKPTGSLLGVIFPRDSAAGCTFDVPLHPTQLYSSLAGFILFITALILEKYMHIYKSDIGTSKNKLPEQITVAKLLLQIAGWIGIILSVILMILSITNTSIWIIFIFLVLLGWSVFIIIIDNGLGRRKKWAQIFGLVIGALWCISIFNLITPTRTLIPNNLSIFVFVLYFSSYINVALGITIILCLSGRNASQWFDKNHKIVGFKKCNNCGKSLEAFETKCPQCGWSVYQYKPYKDGLLFGIIMILYALFRFGIDFVRFYENQSNFWVNQIIALGFFTIALIFTIVRVKNKNN